MTHIAVTRQEYDRWFRALRHSAPEKAPLAYSARFTFRWASAASGAYKQLYGTGGLEIVRTDDGLFCSSDMAWFIDECTKICKAWGGKKVVTDVLSILGENDV